MAISPLLGDYFSQNKIAPPTAEEALDEEVEREEESIDDQDNIDDND